MDYEEKYFKAIYEINGLEGTMYALIPGLKESMKSELMRVYNIYAKKINAGITDKLNDEFHRLYPTYFEDTKDKEWWERDKYNKFMSDGYNRLVVDDLNRTNASPILDFYVDSFEVVFTGCLRVNKNVTISFSLEEV